MINKCAIVRKIGPKKYRLYSKQKGPDGKRKNLGTSTSLEGIKEREKEVQTFKHMADDGKTESKCDKVLNLMSDMAGYLEEAGFMDASQNVYDAMFAVDGSLADDEDYAYDMVSSTPDVQNALPGSLPYEMTGEVAGGMQGVFSIPEATRGSMLTEMVALSGRLDQLGLYKEASELDDIVASWSEYEAGMGRIPATQMPKLDLGPDPDFDPGFEDREKGLDEEIAGRIEESKARDFFLDFFQQVSEEIKDEDRPMLSIANTIKLINNKRSEIIYNGQRLDQYTSMVIFDPKTFPKRLNPFAIVYLKNEFGIDAVYDVRNKLMTILEDTSLGIEDTFAQLLEIFTNMPRI